MDRRAFLKAGAGAGALGPLTPAMLAAAPRATPPASAFEALRKGTLMNLPRAHELMAQNGIDGLIVTRDAHVYHLCNFYPSSGRMGLPNACFGLLSADSKRVPALVVPQFQHYYVYSHWGIEAPYEVYTYGDIADLEAYGEAADRFVQEAQVVQPVPFRVGDPALVSDRQRQRNAVREAAVAAHGLAAGPEWGLIKAARDYGLVRGRIAVDDPAVAGILTDAGADASFVPADRLLRQIRLGRSPTEIAIMRQAAEQNAEAALATARSVRAGMTSRELRSTFWSEAGARGHLGVYMVIDSVSAEPADFPLEEGMGFSIDCVSSLLHYHGDFARTIFIGEPPAMLRRATEASAVGWDAIREKLKAGMRYSEIREIGRDALKKAGYEEFFVTFTPHSVGLFHTDEPGRAGVPFFVKDDLELVENMVLSVDCPCLMDGIGGSVHLEDLSLIKKDGSELLNATTDRVIMV